MKKGRIIYSVYDNCTRPVGGFDPQYLSYMRVDTVPEPTVYRMGKELRGFGVHNGRRKPYRRQYTTPGDIR